MIDTGVSAETALIAPVLREIGHSTTSAPHGIPALTGRVRGGFRVWPPWEGAKDGSAACGGLVRCAVSRVQLDETSIAPAGETTNDHTGSTAFRSSTAATVVIMVVRASPRIAFTYPDSHNDVT